MRILFPASRDVCAGQPRPKSRREPQSERELRLSRPSLSSLLECPVLSRKSQRMSCESHHARRSTESCLSVVALFRIPSCLLVSEHSGERLVGFACPNNSIVHTQTTSASIFALLRQGGVLTLANDALILCHSTTVRHAFRASDDEELSVRVGEELAILHSAGPDWVMVRKSNGAEGMYA